MKETPKSRQIEIFRQLVMSNVPLNIEFFKEKLQKSERTIRYDIQRLKTFCLEYEIEIRYMTKRGFYIPPAQKSACSALLLQWEAEAKDIFADEEEKQRCSRLFFYLLVRNEYVTAERLADIFFASRSTLVRSLSRIEKYFGNCFRMDVKKAWGYRMEGDELELRRQAAKFLTGRFKGSYTAEDWYLLLPEELKTRIDPWKVREISRKIRQMNGKYNIWISNTAYLNLLSYCLIRSVRVPLLEAETEEFHEETYIHELLKELSPNGWGQNLRELEWLRSILSEYGIYMEKHHVDEKLLRQLLEFIVGYIRTLEEWKGIDLEGLRQDLEGHLRNYLAMSRQERHEEINENVLWEIKDYYSLYFQLASTLAELVEEKFHQKLNVMEVCYLAVYLYKNSKHPENERKNVMVVCATGKGLSHFLTMRIKHVFPMLNVVGQVSPYQLSRVSDLKNVDFAISTIPLEDSIIPVVKISGVLLEEDIERIQDFLKYGKLVDDLPMRLENQASFQAKEQSEFLEKNPSVILDGSLASASGTMNQLILTLLEYISKLPPKIHVSQDAMLGMVIHMSISVQRWLSGNMAEDAADDFVREYVRIQKQYPDVFLVMEKFFKMVEKVLQIRLPVPEKVAFFLYILEGEENLNQKEN